MTLFKQIDWEQVSTRIERETWAQQVLEAVCLRVENTLASEIKVPTEPGGWIHDYVCPQHWLPLDYDATEPNQHRCPAGDVHNEEHHHAAWRVWRHRELADMARDAGVLFRITGESTYRDVANTVLQQYAAQYALFTGDDDAQDWMLKGCAFNQALTEALWAVPLAQAYDLIAPELAPVDATNLRENLLVPISQTLSAAHDQLQAQDRLQSNYTAWLIAALGSLGFALEDADLIERAINGPGGFWAHIATAVRADGLEYEGSLYYHNFVTLAYIMLAEAAAGNGFDLYTSSTLASCSIPDMYNALASLAWPDGSFPQLNDGSYWINSIYDAELCTVFEAALARSQNQNFAWLLKQAYARRGVIRDSWLALVIGQQSITDATARFPKNVLLDKSGIAMLHAPDHLQAVCVPFGAYGGGHHHYDRLGPVIWPWSPDAGNPPYGITERREWYQQTAAHNAILVDGQGQERAAGNVVSCNHDTLTLQATDLYPGILITRTVKVQSECIADAIHLASESEHTYTWLCHVDLNSMWDFDGIPQEINKPLTDEGASTFITLTHQFPVSHSVTIYGDVGNRKLAINVVTTDPLFMGYGVCPGNSITPHHPRHVIVIQQRAQTCSFAITYTLNK